MGKNEKEIRKHKTKQYAYIDNITRTSKIKAEKEEALSNQQLRILLRIIKREVKTEMHKRILT